MRWSLPAVCLMSFASVALPAVGDSVNPTTQPPDTISPNTTKPPFVGVRSTVDLAILLDTSNSMDGLIAQAKQQLWTIVNQFALAKKNGQAPQLRVALFEYGNTNLPATEGYIRQVVPLTDDLDELSARLFELKTRGGDEYCGQVISEATTRLAWSHTPNAYKTIFIAGNEPFTQGPIAYQTACKRAIEHGIVVNTIHCGDYKSGVKGQWNQGAALAEGDFLNINQDQAVAHIDAPQDEAILNLNTELNTTYLWYGVDAAYYQQNQLQQDTNASSFSRSAVVQRAQTKSSKMYSNKGRDLVDTYQEDPSVLAKIKTKDLPKSLQTMNTQERTQHINELIEKRASIQKQIQTLSTERDTFVAEETARQTKQGDTTLGDAVLKAIHRQLKAAGYTIDQRLEAEEE